MTMTTALLFPGQGAQTPNMGKDLYDHFSIYRETITEASDLLHEDITSIIFNDSADKLNRTEWSQLAIFVTSIATFRTLQNLFHLSLPFASAGLSLGEYSAFCAAGHLSFQESLLLVQKRGQSMSQACDQIAGKMVALIGTDEAKALDIINQLSQADKIWIANLNSPGQVVLSGYAEAIDTLLEKSKELGIRRAIPLTVHGAFHSGLMKSAQEVMQSHIFNAPFKLNETLLIQNFTAKPPKSEDELKNNLVNQISGTTRWAQSIETLSNNPIDLLLDIGPSQIASIVKRMSLPAPLISISSIDGIKKLEDHLSNPSN